MTDNELNALVAERAMGREVYRGKFPYSKLVLIVPGSWGGVKGYGMEPEVEDCPDYCNDIAAAFQVIAALAKKGFGVSVSTFASPHAIAYKDSQQVATVWIKYDGLPDSRPLSNRCALAVAVLSLVVSGAEVETNNERWVINLLALEAFGVEVEG